MLASSLTAPLMGVALLCNPYGLQYVPYLIEAITMPRPLIAEWGPLWMTHDPWMAVSMFVLSLVLVGMAVIRQPLSSSMGLIGLLVCAAMSWQHLRHGSIYSVVWMCYVPAWLTHTQFGRDIVRGIESRPLVAQAICIAVSMIAVVWSVGYQFWTTTLSGDSRKQTACYPIGAVEYLRQHDFHGNLLTPFHAGAYVSWRMYPDVKVSLDGRYEVAYAPGVFEEHWRFFEAEPDGLEMLDRYPHDAILVDQAAKVRPLLEQFRNDPQPRWQFVYEDASYVVLKRVGPS